MNAIGPIFDLFLSYVPVAIAMIQEKQFHYPTCIVWTQFPFNYACKLGSYLFFFPEVISFLQQRAHAVHILP